uniref:Uncharacterized protein n=1 Tax=Glossina palpalis gambiensis TaxID=67801 RepID=A0A1B0BC49_9MUSC
MSFCFLNSEEFEVNHKRFFTPDFLLIKAVWKDHQMIHCFPYTALFLVSLILILTKKGTKKLIVIIDRFVVHRFTLEHERFFDVTAIMDNVSTTKAFKIFDMEFIISKIVIFICDFQNIFAYIHAYTE